MLGVTAATSIALPISVLVGFGVEYFADRANAGTRFDPRAEAGDRADHRAVAGDRAGH